MRLRFVGLLVGVCVLAGASLALPAWRAHERDTQVAAYVRARSALARLALPAALEPAGPCGEPFCAHSRLRPHAPGPLRAVERLIDGHVWRRPQRFECARDQPCDVIVDGTIDGYPVMAVVMPHFVGIEGDVWQVRPGVRWWTGVYRGSDVSIDAPLPKTTDA